MMKEQEFPVLLVLKYLCQNDFIEAYLSLEGQSKVSLHAYSPELAFFRKILLKGDFCQAVQFIQTFQHRLNPETIKNLTLKIYKQKLYELLQNPNEAQLRNLFENQIINSCSSEDEFQHLFTLLTCRTVKQIPGMDNWTVLNGRFYCFEEIRGVIQQFFTKQNDDSLSVQDDLSAIIEEYMNVRNIQRMGGSTNQRGKNNRRQFSTEKEEESMCGSVYNGVNCSVKSMSSEVNSLVSNKNPIEEEPARYANFSKNKLKFNQRKQQPMNTSYLKLQGEPPSVQELEDDDQSVQSRPAQPPTQKQQKIPSYLLHSKQPQNKRQKHKQTSIREQSKEINLAYLQGQNSSLVFNAEEDRENFTFSHHTSEEQSNNKDKVELTEVAQIRDVTAIRVCKQSPNGRMLAVGSNSACVTFYSIAAVLGEGSGVMPEVYKIVALHTKPVFDLEWSADGKSIASCSSDCTIKLTKLMGINKEYNGHRSTVVGSHDQPVRMLKFLRSWGQLRSGDQETELISCGDDGLIKIWSVKSNSDRLLAVLQGHTAAVSAFALDLYHNLYSVSWDCTVRLWDMNQGCMNISAKHQSEMTSIAWEEGILVIGHKNGMVSIYSPDSLELVSSILMHEQEIRCLASCGSSGYEFITASFDGSIGVLQLGQSRSSKTQMKQSRPNRIQMKASLHKESDRMVFCTYLCSSRGSKGCRRYLACTSTSGHCKIYTYESPPLP